MKPFDFNNNNKKKDKKKDKKKKEKVKVKSTNSSSLQFFPAQGSERMDLKFSNSSTKKLKSLKSNKKMKKTPTLQKITVSRNPTNHSNSLRDSMFKEEPMSQNSIKEKKVVKIEKISFKLPSNTNLNNSMSIDELNKPEVAQSPRSQNLDMSIKKKASIVRKSAFSAFRFNQSTELKRGNTEQKDLTNSEGELPIVNGSSNFKKSMFTAEFNPEDI